MMAPAICRPARLSGQREWHCQFLQALIGMPATLLLLAPGAQAAQPPAVDWRALVPPLTPMAAALRIDGYLLFALSLALKIIFFTVLLTGNRALRLQEWMERKLRLRSLAAIGTLLALILAYQLLLAPVSFSGYLISRYYEIAVEGIGRWMADVLRAWAVQDASLIPLLLVLLAAMRRWPRRWWLPATAAVALFSAFAVYGSPLLIDPLFHHFRPLPASPLRSSILGLAHRAGVHVNGVYIGEFSSTTTEGNAYVTGLGSSERIVLWDTMLSHYPPDQVKAIVAHELGHYALHHIALGLALAILGTGVILFICSRLMTRATARGWMRRPGEPACVPLLAALIMALNLAGMPVANAISRAMEARADRFSIQLTHNPGAFIRAMQHLCRQDYDDPWPNRLEELVFYNHPSISERIHMAANSLQ